MTRVKYKGEGLKLVKLMDISIVPGIGVGRFNLFAKCSEVLKELKTQEKIFEYVDYLTDDSNTAPIYLYVEKQGDYYD